MKEQEIYEFIYNFLKKNLNKEVDIQLESNLSDLQLSSFIFIQMIVELEMQFKIEVDDENLVADNFTTIKDFVSYIDSCVE